MADDDKAFEKLPGESNIFSTLLQNWQTKPDVSLMLALLAFECGAVIARTQRHTDRKRHSQ